MIDGSSIQLVAIDLDGTLLTDSKQITPATVSAIRAATARGVKVVIASARPPRSVRPFHRQLVLDTLQINYNGALIWDEPARRAVYHCPMEAEVVHAVARRARHLFPRVLVSCEILDRWYTDRFDQTFTTETGRLFPPDVVAELETFLTQPITKLMLLGEESLIVELESLLATEFPGQVSGVRCDPHLLQIMNPRVSKAAALRMVAGHYRIPMERVLAVGDAPNDIPMLSEAGLAVAVANAPRHVQQHADWIAPDNNHDGVAAAIERFVISHRSTPSRD